MSVVAAPSYFNGLSGIAPTLGTDGPGSTPDVVSLLSSTMDSALGALSANGGVVPLGPNPPQAAPSQDDVVNYASGKEGSVDGSGQCFDLADNALTNAGFKSARDYDPSLKNPDYKWGKAVDIKGAKPGDVLQFKNYSAQDNTTHPDGSSESDDYGDRQHHTAVVLSNDGNGMVTVLEQNVGETPDEKVVTKRQIYVGGNRTVKNDDGGSTKYTEKGSVVCYRPEPKNS